MGRMEKLWKGNRRDFLALFREDGLYSDLVGPEKLVLFSIEQRSILGELIEMFNIIKSLNILNSDMEGIFPSHTSGES